MKAARKWAWLVVFAVLLTITTAAWAEEVIFVKGIRLSVNKLTVKTGETAEPVAYTLNPENATNKTILWTSQDETIATVSEDGSITGVKAGKTQIHATAEDNKNGTKKAVLNVTVVQPVASITTDVSEVEIGIGSKIRITAAVLPEDATNRKLSWTSSDNKVATVSATGDIIGRGVGEAVITAEAADGSGISAAVRVTVFQPVKNLRLSTQKLSAFVDQTSEPITVTVYPENAKYQDYTWSSSDESIAIVNEKGEVKGVAPGSAKITAVSNEPVTGKAVPKSATCQVRVTQNVIYIGLAKDEEKSTNRKLVLKLTVLPETAANKGVTWTTSDKKIATVQNGTVKIKKREGRTTITATAKDGSGVSASCDVSVGFSGSRITVGRYVWESGVYTWSVDNFRESADMPPSRNNPEDALFEEEREIIELGHYEQDNNADNGKETIKWLVLEKKEDRMLVISLNVLDRSEYYHNAKYPTWEKSDIRPWLNETFFNEAFDETEKAIILKSDIETHDYVDTVKEKTFDGGNDTEDYVFCLSEEEAVKYFVDDIDRRTPPTAYAVAQGLQQSSQYRKNGEGCANWWLRSPGPTKPGSYYNAPAGILQDGRVYIDWADGAETKLGVRPAIWIDTAAYDKMVGDHV